MPSWNDLLAQFTAQPDDPTRSAWLQQALQGSLQQIGQLRAGGPPAAGPRRSLHVSVPSEVWRTW